MLVEPLVLLDKNSAVGSVSPMHESVCVLPSLQIPCQCVLSILPQALTLSLPPPVYEKEEQQDEQDQYRQKEEVVVEGLEVRGFCVVVISLFLRTERIVWVIE